MDEQHRRDEGATSRTAQGTAQPAFWPRRDDINFQPVGHIDQQLSFGVRSVAGNDGRLPGWLHCTRPCSVMWPRTARTRTYSLLKRVTGRELGVLFASRESRPDAFLGRSGASSQLGGLWSAGQGRKGHGRVRIVCPVTG